MKLQKFCGNRALAAAKLIELSIKSSHCLEIANPIFSSQALQFFEYREASRHFGPLTLGHAATAERIVLTCENTGAPASIKIGPSREAETDCCLFSPGATFGAFPGDSGVGKNLCS